MTKMKRRDFIVTGAAAGIAFPMIMKQSTVKPLVIASANGNRFKNGGTVTAVQKAFQMMTSGSDVLDALIAGVNIVELDPLDDSVGYGGLPMLTAWFSSIPPSCMVRRSRQEPWVRWKACARRHSSRKP